MTWSHRSGSAVTMTSVESAKRSLITRSACALLAACIAIPLAAGMDGLLLHYRLISPGMYVWHLSHPYPRPGLVSPVTSLLATMIVVDSTCWFILLSVAGFAIDRAVRRKKQIDSASAAS